ncbi:MAG: DNA-directed RNA polymerase specialized sigma24 family protein [Rhodothermales bacterium]|jgi:DNA-directed RNA polymerase specialized sigma24 family protein
MASRRDQYRAAFEDGTPPDEIAEAFGVTEDTIRAALKEMGLELAAKPSTRVRAEMTEDEQEIIRYLNHKGWDYGRIARERGFLVDEVKAIFKRPGRQAR